MDKFSDKSDFFDIDEELTWCFFKQNGNPYIAQDMVNARYHSKDVNLDLGK